MMFGKLVRTSSKPYHQSVILMINLRRINTSSVNLVVFKSRVLVLLSQFSVFTIKFVYFRCLVKICFFILL
jgi:hypothetical protein